MVFKTHSTPGKLARPCDRTSHQPTEQDWSNRHIALMLGGITAAAVTPGLFAYTALAQTLFPDVAADYWAQPFIEKLAQQDIVAGYPDGTFRPEQVIDRDEYAAVIRQAFEANTERGLPSASALSDVPENYWAADAIEEAYETGFMGLPAENQFNPRNEVTRADALLALVQGLELADTPPTAAVSAAPATVAAEAPPQTAQAQRGTPFHLAIPMASTQIMQLFAPPAAAPPATAPPTAASPDTPPTETLGAIDLAAYYTDAAQIPDYARDGVATATRMGLVVNYPDASLLNPTQPLSRGGMAALIHQALVYQDQLEPLPAESSTAPYLVGEEPPSQN